MEVDKLASASLGELLQEEFLGRSGMNIHDSALAINMPVEQLEEAMSGNNRLCAELALRLSRYFGTSAHFWMSIDAHHSLEIARQQLGDSLFDIQPHGRSIFDGGENLAVVKK